MNPPYDKSMAIQMNQWLQQQSADIDDSDLLNLAAWLDGRVDGRQYERSRDRVEMLLAADPQWLASALDMQNLHAEPVLANELQLAQALISAGNASERRGSWRLLVQRCKQSLQPLPLAFAATITALVMVGSVRMGQMAALEFGSEDLQTASMLQVTRLDFGASDTLAMNDPQSDAGLTGL